jgi:hypothetical protein
MTNVRPQRVNAHSRTIGVLIESQLHWAKGTTVDVTKYDRGNCLYECRFLDSDTSEDDTFYMESMSSAVMRQRKGRYDIYTALRYRMIAIVDLGVTGDKFIFFLSKLWKGTHCIIAREWAVFMWVRGEVRR